MERSAVIIVAGGHGRRMGASQPKQFLFLDNEPVLVRTVRAFAEALPGAELVVVLPEEHLPYWRDLAARFDVPRHTAVGGGSERFDSVRRGLEAVSDAAELIAVHDGVRPLVSRELILRTFDAARSAGAAIPVVAPADSVRALDADGSHPLDRSRLRLVQTPQVFRAELLREAYAGGFDPAFTDDASAVEAAGHAVALCEGDRQNLKITTPEDLLCAEALLREGDDKADETARTDDADRTDKSDGADRTNRTDGTDKTAGVDRNSRTDRTDEIA